MNRCLPTLFCLLLAAAPALPAFAQDAQQASSTRPFPRTALRGTFMVVSPPDIRIDGKPDRLSPGARIRSMENMLVMSGSVVGRQFIVNYTRDASGLVHEVWVLTDAEIAEKREGATAPRNFLFGSEAGAPKRDDGKTPYNELPGYGAQR